MGTLRQFVRIAGFVGAGILFGLVFWFGLLYPLVPITAAGWLSAVACPWET